MSQTAVVTFIPQTTTVTHAVTFRIIHHKLPKHCCKHFAHNLVIKHFVLLKFMQTV